MPGLKDTMKKLRKRAYEKSGKKYKDIGRFGEDEYMKQDKLPGMKKGGKVEQKSKGRRMTKDELNLAKEMSKRTSYKTYDSGKSKVFKSGQEAAETDVKLQKLVDYNRKKGDPVDADIIGMKSFENPTGKMGSFKKGGLAGKQKKLDANKDGKISGEDFKILRGKANKMKGGGIAIKGTNFKGVF